jgi:hypothetical protein
VERPGAGGGAGEELELRRAALTTSGREAEQGSRVPEEEEEGRGSEGLVCKNREVQGPQHKLKFPTDPKA